MLSLTTCNRAVPCPLGLWSLVGNVNGKKLYVQASAQVCKGDGGSVGFSGLGDRILKACLAQCLVY